MAKTKKVKLDKRVESEIEIHIDNTMTMLERHLRRTLIIGGLLTAEDAPKLKDILYKDVIKTTNATLKKRMKDAVTKL